MIFTAGILFLLAGDINLYHRGFNMSSQDELERRVTKRIEGIEKTQRAIIKELEAIRSGQVKPSPRKKSVTPPSNTGSLDSTTLSRKDNGLYAYHKKLTNTPTAIFNLRRDNTTTGKVEAVVSGLDKLSGKTSWFFHATSTYEQIACLVYGGRIRIETTAGYNTEQSRAKRNGGSGFKLGKGKHRIVVEWDNHTVLINIYNEQGKKVSGSRQGMLAPLNKASRIAIGRQALSWGTRANVGSSVYVHEARLSLK